MKVKSLLCLALVSVALFSCKDKDDDDAPAKPTPAMSIKAGYFDNFEFKTYKNQEAFPVDSIAASTEFGLSFIEKDIELPDDFSLDSLKMEFDVKTNDDVEHFVLGSNVSTTMTSYISFGSMTELSGVFGISYQFSAVAVPGNDTIEINNLGDLIRVNYQSQHSALKGNKIFTILP